MIPLAPRLYALAALLAVLVAVFGFGYSEGYRHERKAREVDTAKREKAESVAIIARTAENAKKAEKQAKDNAAIQKANDEELAAVRTRLAAAERMRKPAFCSGSSTTVKAESAGSSTPADPASGLLPEPVAEDIQALILRTEEVAATARACQAFITANGMTP